jgi:hypothetical protein
MVLVAASAFVYGGGVQEDDAIGRQWFLCADARRRTRLSTTACEPGVAYRYDRVTQALD